MEENVRTFNSYKSLFKINFKIYDLGGKTLPRPVPLDALAMAIIIFLSLYPVGRLISPSHPWLITATISGVVSWIMSQADPQGKFMPLFFKDLLGYFLRPKTYTLGGRKINKLRNRQVYWHLPEVVD